MTQSSKSAPAPGPADSGAAAGSGSGPRPAAGSGAGSGAAPVSPRNALGGWLEGPRIESGQDEWAYRGQRLGLPETGSGSLAPQGRRLGALLVDWALAVLITKTVGAHPTSQAGGLVVLGIFGLEHLVLLSTLGYTIGKRLFGTTVGRLGGGLTPLHVLLRTVLLMVVVPAVIWDRDGRGLHDRFAGTVEVLR